MAPQQTLEEPVEHEGVIHYFNSSLADFDQFATRHCVKCLANHRLVDRYHHMRQECNDHIGWPTKIGPIDHHLGKCCLECDQLLLVAPRWEALMEERNDPSFLNLTAEEVYNIGRNSYGYNWKLEDVEWYHRNHTSERNDWWDEEYVNQSWSHRMSFESNGDYM